MLATSRKVPIPLLIDDENLSAHGYGKQPPNIPSRLGLFVSTCHLFEILHEILSNFYASDQNIEAQKLKDSDNHIGLMLADVSNYNRRLEKFHNAIPAYLNATRTPSNTGPEKHSCLNLQQQVLYCR